jgi:hypothetical protein
MGNLISAPNNEPQATLMHAETELSPIARTARLRGSPWSRTNATANEHGREKIDRSQRPLHKQRKNFRAWLLGTIVQ